MTSQNTETGRFKPPLLRAIFILNALKILLALGLLIGFKYFDLNVGSVSGSTAVTMIFWTMLGYIATFAAMVISILKRSLMGLRIAIVIDLVISIPAKAFIGILISVISIGLSFSKPVKTYFAWREN